MGIDVYRFCLLACILILFYSRNIFYFFKFVKMNITRNYYLFLSLFLLSLASACTSDDESPAPVATGFGTGIYIVNEGPFTNGTGTISYYNREDASVEQAIFSTANDGLPLGNIVQSMMKYNGQAYMVVNNSNKIEVADSRTFESTGSVEDLALPRYMLPINETKAYVSQWGNDGLTGSVAVVDLATNTVNSTIPTGSGAEKMLQIENKVYVTNSGGFGRDSILTVIDANTDELIESIVLGDNPSSLQVDANGALWVLCGGYTDFYDASNNTNGGLYKIVDGTLTATFDLSNGASNLVINNTGDRLYFTMNGGVYSFDLATEMLNTTPFINRYFYDIAVDVNGNILGADAKDFVAEGEVVIYDANGMELSTFGVGLIPGSFWVD